MGPELMLLYLVLGSLLLSAFAPRDPARCNIFGPIFSGISALVGGALNRKDQKQANVANSPIGQKNAYEAAGLNPVPFMLGGGFIPQQASSIGDAFSTAGARFGQSVDAFRKEKLQETELKKENTELREKLDKLVSRGAPGYMQQYGAILPLPSVGGSNAGRDIQNLSGGPAGRGSDASTDVEPGPATVTNVGIVGGDTYVHPRFKDAEMSETRYGDIAQEVVGATNIVMDNWYNDRIQAVGDAYGPKVAATVNEQYARADGRSLQNVIADVTDGLPKTSDQKRGP